jgi:hypothetical protein
LRNFLVRGAGHRYPAGVPTAAAIVLVTASALIAVVGIVGALRLHVHVPKGLAPARWFAAPLPVLLAATAFALLAGQPVLATPLIAAAVLCATASWTVAPTRRGQIARFEHHFWRHVEQQHPHARVGD